MDIIFIFYLYILIYIHINRYIDKIDKQFYKKKKKSFRF